MEDVLFQSSTFVVGEFICPPGDDRWSETNAVSDAPHLVFPRTSVVIHQRGRDPILADRNHVIFYNPSQEFRRGLHDRRGDVSVFVEVAHAGDFSFGHAPADPHTYLVQHVLVRSLRQREYDALYVEEVLVELVQRSLERGVAFHEQRRRRARPRADGAHRSLVTATRELLAAQPTTRATLGEIAYAVNTSPFHLARVFRDWTGSSIHEYRTQLRLRLALDHLQCESDLASIALDVGFSSHSHFTTAFRASFGISPSAARGRHLSELRTILEARLRIQP